MKRGAVTAAVLFALTLLLLAPAARLHPYGTYGTETDFYHLYAPDADRIAAGVMPANTYQGPGYSLLLSLFPDRFSGGKIISVVSAAAVVALTFLLFEGLFGFGAGLGAALLVAVSGRFAEYAISATTDVFFLMLSVLVLLLLTRERYAFAGVAAGLAFLTRYNAVSLVVAALLLLAWRREWKRAGVFAAGFLIVALPWVVIAPPNTNYLNIATRFYPELAGGRTDQDATRVLANDFHSFGDVVRRDPARIVREYPRFVWESVKNAFTMSVVGPGVALLALLGMALAFRRHPLLPLAALLHLLLVSLTHWETRYYFPVMVIFAGLAVYAVGWLCRRLPRAVPVAIVALLCLLSARQSSLYVHRLLTSHPVEVAAACGSFDGSILARKPHLGAICGQPWVFFPPVRSTEELQAWLEKHPVDYVAYGRPEAMSRPELRALADPRGAPPWLRPVFFSSRPRLVVYKVSAARSTPGR